MPCCVVNPGCTAPANATYFEPLRTKCFACGMPVCKNCSRRMPWYGWRKKRICDSCREDHEDKGE